MLAPRPWALVSSAAAPVLLVGGWTAAAVRQPGAFDATTETISALAALDATDRWLMTAALVGTGACHVLTALGLRGARPAGRAVLATGGVATALVGAFPLPGDGGGDGGGSVAHVAAAGAAFGCLAVWPALGDRRWVPAAAVLVGLLGLFGASLATGRLVGGTERAAAAAQAVWPLVAVLDGLLSRRGAGARAARRRRG